MDAHALRVSLLISLLCAVSVARGSDTDTVKAVLTLPEVTVFAISGSAAQNFTSEQIRNSNAQNAAEFLEAVPGVSVRRDGVSGGYSTVKIGGSNANQVLVLVNGVVWNDVGSGEANLASIPTEWIESLSIYRGSSTTLSGEAIGGIIEIHTTSAKQKSYSGSITALETEREFSISRGAATEKMEWFSAYSRLQGEGNYKFRITEEDGNGPFTEHLGGVFSRENNFVTRDMLTASFAAQWNPRGLARVNCWLSESSFGMPGYLAPRPTPQATGDESRRTVSLNVTQDFTVTRLELSASHSERRYHFSDPDPLSWIHNSHEAAQRSAVTITSSEVLNSIGLIQTAGLQREIIGSETISGGEAERWKRNAGIFASRALLDEDAHGVDLKVNAGLRGEDFGDFDPVALPEASLALGKEGIVRHHFMVSASRAYRAPSFYDLFWNDELLSIGNPELRPETSSLLRGEWRTVAGEAHPTSLYLSASDNQVKDLIYWHPAFDGHWTPDNLRKASLRSLQVELSREWISNHLESNVSYEWLEARDRSENRLTAGKYLIYRAPRTAHASLNGMIGRWGLRGDYLWSGKQYVLETNSKWLSGYQLLNLSISRTFYIEKVSVSFALQVENATNENYRVVRHAPMPLRQFRITLNLKTL